MKKTTTPRKGAWRNVGKGIYVKHIGSYGTVKFGATVRVSFIPFPTCEIMDANGVHIAIPESADEKKFVTAARKVYIKDTKAEAARLQKREATRTKPGATAPKWKPPSQIMYGLTSLIKDPHGPKPSASEAEIEQKLALTDAARRKKAHALWMRGKESGTPRDIYLRLYAADAKKYRK